MAGAISAREPIVIPGSWAPTPIFFRWLQSLNPLGNGSATGVLHGNPGGSPTWGPVDLAADVTGVLPTANGGLGGITGIAGGLLYATGASSYSVTPAGTAHQVLHGSATTPTWSAVDLALDTTGHLDLAAKVSGVLPVVNGGTGVTTKTGSGSVVLNNSPTLLNSLLNTATVEGFLDATCGVSLLPDPLGLGQLNGQMISFDCLVIAINNATQTTLFGLPWGLFFILHDKTSGGMVIGAMDAIGGITVLINTMVGVAITMSAGHLLQAKVTAGASPRNISVMLFVLKTP